MVWLLTTAQDNEDYAQRQPDHLVIMVMGKYALPMKMKLSGMVAHWEGIKHISMGSRKMANSP